MLVPKVQSYYDVEDTVSIKTDVTQRYDFRLLKSSKSRVLMKSSYAESPFSSLSSTLFSEVGFPISSSSIMPAFSSTSDSA